MSSSGGGPGPSAPQSAPPGPDNKAKRINSRQLLSCTKCRERKVKCDRTKPCQACCARGHPKECEFVMAEGNDYMPVQQSYELKRLRRENQYLKAELHKYGCHIYSGDEDDDDGAGGRRGSTSTSRAAAARQRQFKTSSRIDNLYFGTPSLANIVQDFSHMHLGSQSLTHTLPKGKDMYAVEDTNYPFHIFAQFSSLESLVELLPDRDELFLYLDIFQRRAQSCSFPQMPNGLPIARAQIESFLNDGHRNASNSPDTLALLFAMLATAMQVGQYDRSGGDWIEGAVEQSRHESDVYIGASMQALRHASFMSRPTLCGIQTLVMIGPYLTNSGRFLDAWTLFGTTIRLAHSTGLHRDPKLLDPTPQMPESTMRQTLWWWILHMDQQYSVTLGRPLGISGIGDCPPPKALTTNQMMLRLNEFIDQFTMLARQILASNEMMSGATVDKFTERLISLWDTMPQALQFTVSWCDRNTTLPEWPLDVMAVNLFVKVQSFIVLLNRQRQDGKQSSGSPHNSSRSAWTSPSDQDPPARAPQKGRPLVVGSCELILHAFLFFYFRQKAMLICWTMGQQAFNACMILILDAFETGNFYHERTINQAYSVFDELNRKGVHKLAETAVQRISSGLMLLEERKREQERTSFSGRQHHQHSLDLDTASMTDFSGDAVMGNTGMFLLEDPGSQFYNPQSANYRTMDWMMPTSAHTSNPSRPPTPGTPSPESLVSDMTVMPFPVMSPPTVPVTTAPFALGLQPRMPIPRGRVSSSCHPSRSHGPTHVHEVPHSQADFTPVNTAYSQHSQQQQSFPHHRGPVRQPNGHHSSSRSNQSSGTGPRSQHRSSTNGQKLEKAPKSHRRR